MISSGRTSEPLQLRHFRSHGPEIAGHVELIRVGELRQLRAKVILQLRTQREVFLQIFLQPAQMEPVHGRSPFQFDRDEHQGGVPCSLSIIALEPFELPECEVKDIDPLFLHQCPRLGEQSEQAPLQSFGAEGGLKLRIDVPPGRGAVGRLVVLIRLRQPDFIFEKPGRPRRLALHSLSREKTKGLFLLHQEPADLIGTLLINMHQARGLARLRDAQEPVSGREVEQFLPILIDDVGDG